MRSRIKQISWLYALGKWYFDIKIKIMRLWKIKKNLSDIFVQIKAQC